jgi:cytochrome P450
VAEALFGVAVGPEVDRISEAMDRNVTMFRRVIQPWGPLRVALPTPANFRYHAARWRLRATLRRFIAERRASRASGTERDDLLSRLLAARDTEAAEAGGMSETQLVDECVTLFAAGHETTANALTFALRLLSHHPEAAGRLRDEADRVLGDGADGGRMATAGDLDALPYARMAIAEAMRLYPPAWIQGRQALEPCEVAGHAVPRGAVVFVSQWVNHRDPRWWPDPETFDPGRFDPQRPDPGRPRWAYFPFGGGSRSCVGEAFAWAEATIVLATVVRRWRLEPVEPGPIPLEPGITLRPAREVRMVMRRRP